MKKTIDTIVWPTHAKDAVRLYRRFELSVIERFGISFSPSGAPDPVLIVRDLIDDKPVEEMRKSALAIWWDIVDKHGITNFRGRNALMARVAICLLHSSEETVAQLPESMSWFFEVLEFMEHDVQVAIEMMERFFEHRRT